MKLVVGYFGPYLFVKKNISARVVKKLKGIRCPKILFPARFNKKIFLKPLYQYKPDIYLILAHNPKGKHIQVELRGVNLKTGTGRKYEVSTFKPHLVGSMKYSKNAGRYVCNYVVYTVLREIRVKRRATQLCFLHIPGSYDIHRAAREVKSFIDHLSHSHPQS